MSEPDFDLELRTATMADAEMVADLESIRDPDDPRDPIMLRFWWSTRPPDEAHMELIAEKNGTATAYVAAGHEPWEAMPKRFGWLRPVLDPKIWSESRFGRLIGEGEEWLRKEDGAIAVTRVRESFEDQRGVFENLGYREERRSRIWELDLVAERQNLLAGADDSRRRMESQGVGLLTVEQDDDPDKLSKLYKLTIAAELDIPTTVPWRTMPYDEWHRFWFENPGIRPDRFWIAREGEAMVGLSVMGFPPTRGVPWTFFTGTSRTVRGRGVARALKYETVAQAMEFGVQRVRTQNDGANAPILRLNDEMGYRLVDPMLELHRELGS
jgi:RimJ/RimL family protein N-acetyltransferase